MFDLSGLAPVLRVMALGISLFGAITAALLLATWFSLILWTFHDIRTRSNDVFTQLMATLMVAVLLIPGALLYTLLRPPETLGAARERSLLEQALQPVEDDMQYVCPGCGDDVDPRWMVCPHCLYQLREPCPQCGELMELDWRSCAYCGQLTGERQLSGLLPSATPAPALTVQTDRATPPRNGRENTAGRMLTGRGNNKDAQPLI